ncbi:TRAP transporter small permease [Desertibacillus haloalkaliphilus]|nr:TRAP transporter small permease [Desertibacillus haloalkaliphilus]
MNRTIENITCVLLVIMVLLVFIQIVSRAAFGSSYAWTEEIARFLMIWITFLGASVAFQYGSHISIDFFISKLKHRIAKWVQLIASLAIVTFLLILLVKGYQIIETSMIQRSASLRIPMGYVYTIMPISAVLMLMNVIDVSIKVFRIHPTDISKAEKGET